jgi:hypothetical protein
MLPSLTLRQRALLTSWIVEQHELGVDEPTITGDIISLAKLRTRLSFSRMVERVLTFTDKHTEEICGRINPHDEAHGAPLLAWTECINSRELDDLLSMMEGEGMHLIYREWGCPGRC